MSNDKDGDIRSMTLQDLVGKYPLNDDDDKSSKITTTKEWFSEMIRQLGGDKETARTKDALPDSLRDLEKQVQSEAVTIHNVAETYSHRPFEFAACLIVKNANAMLPEWLAYHYTFLPLRRVVIGVDPTSLDRPPPELMQKYRDIGLNITLWMDDWYIVDGRWSRQKVSFIKNYTSLPPEQRDHYDGYVSHLWRQNNFYRACLQTLKQEGHSWTAVWDLDEYLMFNYFIPQEVDDKITAPEALQAIQNGTSPRGRLPKTRQRRFVTAAEFMASGIDKAFQESRCIVYPRLSIGPLETDETFQSSLSFSENGKKKCPSCHWNVSHYFYTNRFYHHNSIRWNQDRPGKSMVDLSRLNQIRRAPGPHIPFGVGHCGYQSPLWWDKSFRFHHYSGTAEQFALKQRTEEDLLELYPDYKEYIPLNLNTSIPDWLPHFVQAVGDEKLAYELTQKAIQEGLAELRTKLAELRIKLAKAGRHNSTTSVNE